MTHRDKKAKDNTGATIPTSDGAVRELEKSDMAVQTEGPDQAVDAGKAADVVPIGKYGSGAPEDAIADAGESRARGRK